MMALSWVTIALVGAAIIVASLSLGRSLLAVVAAAAAAPRVWHDVYAFALGFCVFGSALETGSRLTDCLAEPDASAALGRLYHAAKCCVAGLAVGGVLAPLVGALFDLAALVPLRVKTHQSPELLGVGQWMWGLLVLKLGYRLLVDSAILAAWAPGHLYIYIYIDR